MKNNYLNKEKMLTPNKVFRKNSRRGAKFLGGTVGIFKFQIFLLKYNNFIHFEVYQG